jgi:DNA adenine methylase
LIALYQAIQDGWTPPARLSEAEYAAARQLPRSDPMHALAGVAASFGGKWFGGYARTEGRDIYSEGRRALLRDVPNLTRPFVASFLDIEPFEGLGFIYCDPPYAGTLPYRGAPPFDSAAFWRRAAQWSTFCPAFVSEYVAPEGWRCIWERAQKTTVAIGEGKLATERLWTR